MHREGTLYRRYGKRFFDLATVIPTAVLLLPLAALIALFIRIRSGQPILFIQDRLGLHGCVFQAYKFRTMTNFTRTSNREVLSGDPEVTTLGAWLRRFKLDELPQFLNVLKGDMSIVGPRPDLPAHIKKYDGYGKRRLLVLPGLTGLAQVRGNIYLTWPERWQHDAEYVEHLSFRLDIRIIWWTIGVLLLGDRHGLRSSLDSRRKGVL